MAVAADPPIVKPMTIDELVMHDTMRNGQEMARAQQQYAMEKTKFQAKLDAERAAYFKVYKARRDGQASKEEVDAARKPFAQILLAKDMLYLSYLLPEGPDSKLMDAVDMLSGGKVDGGIHDAARPLFDDWVIAVRKHMGAEPGQFLFVRDAEKFHAAIAASTEFYSDYMDLRNKAEMAKQGYGKMPERVQPEAYRKKKRAAAAKAEEFRLLDQASKQADVEIARMREEKVQAAAATRKAAEDFFSQRFSGPSGGEQARLALIEGFTVASFDSVWERIHRAPKTPDGKLADPRLLRLPAGTTDPYDALLTLLVNEHSSPTQLQWVIDDMPGRSVSDGAREWVRLSKIAESRGIVLREVGEGIYRSIAFDNLTRVRNPAALGGWSDRPGQLLRERLTFGSPTYLMKALDAKRWPAGSDPWAELKKGKSTEEIKVAAKVVLRAILQEPKPYDDVPDDIVERLRAAMAAGAAPAPQ